MRRPWREVAGELGLDRGSFWHLAYRIEQFVGRDVFRSRAESPTKPAGTGRGELVYHLRAGGQRARAAGA